MYLLAAISAKAALKNIGTAWNLYFTGGSAQRGISLNIAKIF
jgi:hypothetical protein